MAWDEGLEGVHLDIAGEEQSPLYVLAGPGTGKTFAMMRRVARLLESGVDPGKILAISFTRTAASDLREQLANLGTPGAEAVRASTLHSLCFGLLHQKAVFDQTGRVPRPLLNFEAKYLERDLAGAHGGIREVRRLIDAYEAAWARLQTESPGGPSNQIDAAFHATTLEWLRYHRAVLVGELIPLTLAYDQQNPAEPIVPEFEHVLVDEYQDLNRAEQELVELLARAGTLTVVGDDCQSVYSFRHANPEGIRNFPANHPGTIQQTILECRRCPPNVVSMSNALIAQEPLRTREIPLAPNPHRADATVYVVQHQTPEQEVVAIADFVEQHLAAHPDLRHGQVLVLAPRRFIGNAIRDELIGRGLNSMSYFTEDPLEPSAAAEGFALMTLLVRPLDRAALRAWIGMGSPSGLPGGYKRVCDKSIEEGVEPSEVLARLAAGQLTLPHTTPLVARWRELAARRAALSGLAGLDLVRAIWDPDDEDCNDIRLMAEAIAVHGGSAGTILDELLQDVTQPYLPDSDGDVIRVMSLHKSKGLTAAVVIIAGSMAGAVPHVDGSLPAAEQDAQLREQRRLFYVAITRATDTLVVSAPTLVPFGDAMRAQVTVARRRGNYAVVAMSPFVQELGASCPATMTTAQWRAAWGRG